MVRGFTFLAILVVQLFLDKCCTTKSTTKKCRCHGMGMDANGNKKNRKAYFVRLYGSLMVLNEP